MCLIRVGDKLCRTPALQDWVWWPLDYTFIVLSLCRFESWWLCWQNEFAFGCQLYKTVTLTIYSLGRVTLGKACIWGWGRLVAHVIVKWLVATRHSAPVLRCVVLWVFEWFATGSFFESPSSEDWTLLTMGGFLRQLWLCCFSTLAVQCSLLFAINNDAFDANWSESESDDMWPSMVSHTQHSVPCISPIQVNTHSSE